MLELRPNCELCDRDLPPASPDARICTYECTWCVDCAENVLHDVCPNCGGNLVPRPIRPRASLERHPASTARVHTPYSRAQIDERTAASRGVPPTER
jgi:hypothetical protein